MATILETDPQDRSRDVEAGGWAAGGAVCDPLDDPCPVADCPDAATCEPGAICHLRRAAEEARDVATMVETWRSQSAPCPPEARMARADQDNANDAALRRAEFERWRAALMTETLRPGPRGPYHPFAAARLH